MDKKDKRIKFIFDKVNEIFNEEDYLVCLDVIMLLFERVSEHPIAKNKIPIYSYFCSQVSGSMSKALLNIAQFSLHEGKKEGV